MVKKIEQMHQDRADKVYIHAIATVTEQILPPKKKPLTFINGSTTVYDIDNLDILVSRNYIPAVY